MISESFTPINTPSDKDISGGYSELTKLSEGLFRAKKAGKFFILKTAKDTSTRSVNLLKVPPARTRLPSRPRGPFRA